MRESPRMLQTGANEGIATNTSNLGARICLNDLDDEIKELTHLKSVYVKTLLRKNIVDIVESEEMLSQPQ